MDGSADRERFPRAWLVGRDREQRMLRSTVSSARSGAASAVTLVGPSGVGKTALLAWTAQLAVHSSCRVLWACGFESDVHVGYAGLLDLLRPIGDLIHVLPARSADALRAAFALDDGVTRAGAVAAATLMLIAAAAEREPIVCLVDDAQWLDRGSLECIRFASRRLHNDRACVIAATREATVPRTLGRMVDIPGLTRDAAWKLAQSARPDLDDRGRGELVATSAGIPLDLLWSPAANGKSSTGPSVRSASQGFGELVATRSAAQQFAALAVALASGGLAESAVDELGIAAGFDAADALDELSRSGLIERSAGRWVPRHPLARAAIVESATTRTRRRAHRTLAHLADASERPDHAIWHLAAAAVGFDVDIACDLERLAGHCMAVGDMATAARAFEQAARLVPDDKGRCRLLISAASAAAQAGEAEVELLDRAEACATTCDEYDEILLWRSLAATWRGDYRLALDAVESHSSQIDGMPSVATAMVLACATGAAFQALDLPRMADFERRTEPFVAAVASLDGPMAIIPVNSGFVDAARGDIDRARRRLIPSAKHLAAAEFNDVATPCAYALMWSEEFDAAGELLDAVSGAARDRGAIAALAWFLVARAHLEGLTGSLDDAASLNREALELSATAEGTFAVATCHAQLSWIAALRGDRAALDEAAAGAGSTPYSMAQIEHARGLLEIGVGDPEAAMAHLLRAWSPVRDARHFNPALLPAVYDVAETAIRLGDNSLITEAVQSVQAAAAATAGRWPRLVLDRIALLRGAQQDVDQLSARALESAAAFPSGFERARTELAVGERLRRVRRRGDARRHLSMALQRFDALGASVWSERAVAELVAAGGRVPEGASMSAGSRPEALTATEWTVARAVATGASNVEVGQMLFLSRKTVEGHLTRIFRKTSTRNRSELVGVFIGWRSATTGDDSRPG